jgi:hypothetical protein
MKFFCRQTIPEFFYNAGFARILPGKIKALFKECKETAGMIYR